MSLYLLLAVFVLMGFALLVWRSGRRPGAMRNSLAALEKLVETDPRVQRLNEQDRALSEAEIDEALKLIPTSSWRGAQVIVARLEREDTNVVRGKALEHLAAVDLPPTDYWTVPALVSLAGRPLPTNVVSRVLRQFRAATADREMFTKTLVNIGTADAATVLVEALNAESKRYLTRMRFPIETASTRDWLEPEFRRILSDYFAARVASDPNAFAKDDGACMWLQIDPKRATDKLTQPPFWHAEFPQLWEVVRDLRDNAASIPEERIWALYQSIGDKENMAGIRHTLVWLLARIHSRRVDPLIHEMKQSPNTYEDALRAEAALAGIISPGRIIDRHLENPGYNQSPPPIKHLWAVQVLGMELQNGGIHQYFFNSSGDLWPDALKGLEEIGYRKSATAFQKAMEVFGSNLPSTNRAERIKQLDRFSNRDEKTLDTHGDNVYEGFKETNLWPYIMQHADIFREETPRS